MSTELQLFAIDKQEIRRQERINQFVDEYLVDLSAPKAAQRCGWRNPGAGGVLMKRIEVRMRIAERMHERNLRAKANADGVLLALVQQLDRLTKMLGQDIADLYTEAGGIKPIADWPDVWRRRLVTEIHSEDTFDYSKDGVQAEESKTWDKSGTVTKIKRESTLAIEKQITATLEMIGRHVGVKAFEVDPSIVVNNNLQIRWDAGGESIEELERRLDAAKQRLITA